MKIPKQELIDEAIRMKSLLNRIPNMKDCVTIGKYSYGTYVRNFGSWRNMTKEIFEDNRVIDNNKYCMSCDFCKETIEKPKSAIRPHNFCSNSCAAKYNNKMHPKRKREWKCAQCTMPIRSGRKYCESCFTERNKCEDITLDQYLKMYGDSGSNKFNIIRKYARKVINRVDSTNCCFNCKYDKHVEICHIKQIKDFPRTAMLSEINNINNLIKLCPNCHWELDHGIADWIAKR